MTRVLIVDDSADFRRLARLLLEQEGFDVLGEAADGPSADRALGTLAPDLVLLDVNLPGESGFEIAARISQAPGGPAVLLTSTHDESDYADLARRSGAKGFVAKDDLSAATIARALS